MYEIMTIKCIEKQLKITRCFVCTSHLNKVGAWYNGLKSILKEHFHFYATEFWRDISWSYFGMTVAWKSHENAGVWKWERYILVWIFYENVVKMQVYENENGTFLSEYVMKNSWKCWSMKMRILFNESLWYFVLKVVLT